MVTPTRVCTVRAMTTETSEMMTGVPMMNGDNFSL
ncbi:hypothetical protein L917_11520 [Phytophthora nicotianae]|nr:hypothetical protein L917_11520 [Phytophthora nicotianae]ETM42851.1 hypothetical protein L914_11565 [Phytophthora nicotianae]